MSNIDKLAWVYIKNKQLLGARSKGKETYYIPGGKREVGENDQQALLREIKEELSVDLIPATIHYAGVFIAQAHDKHVGIQVKITCYFADYSGDIAANAEIEEILWLTVADKNKCSPVTTKIMDWLQSEGLIA